MASFIDIAFFEGLKPLMILLIVFAMVYGVLIGSKILGGNKNLSAIIAFVIGLIIMISAKISQVIMILIPWFIVVAIFLILVVIAFKTLGLPDENLMSAAANPQVYWTLLIIGVILLVAAIGAVYGQEELGVTKENVSQITFSGAEDTDGDGIADTDTGNYENNVKATIYHPRMLGFLVIILIGIFAVNQLTRD